MYLLLTIFLAALTAEAQAARSNELIRINRRYTPEVTKKRKEERHQVAQAWWANMPANKEAAGTVRRKETPKEIAGEKGKEEEEEPPPFSGTNIIL